jgi:hypothetical protein
MVTYPGKTFAKWVLIGQDCSRNQMETYSGDAHSKMDPDRLRLFADFDNSIPRQCYRVKWILIGQDCPRILMATYSGKA